MASDHVFETSDDNFERDVLKANVPVLVDFWAVWCGPCRALSPIIDQVAAANQGKIKVVKVNTDENPNAPSQYGVRGIPTVILFKDGQVVDQVVGVVPATQLQGMIDKAVAA